MPSLDALIGAVTVLFTLSLAVERIAGLFKRWNWQPFQLLTRFLGAPRYRVDLRIGEVFRDGAGISRPQRDRILRQINAENTLFIGISLALATGANAFTGVAGMHTYAGWLPPWSEQAALVTQVIITGAAGGIGSSFWYDLLGLLIEVRRTRAQLRDAGTQQSASVPISPDAPQPTSNAPGTAKPWTPLVLAPQHAAEQAAAEAELQVLQARPEVLEAYLLDVPRSGPEDTCLEMHVRLQPGATLPFRHVTVQTEYGARDIPVVIGS